MADNTRIEWANATWNPIRAKAGDRWGYHCERISKGCQNCYAERMNGRTLPAWGTGLDYNVPNREKIEIYLDEKELLKPLSWRKPKTIFPCSMTDAFADFVPDDFIDRMFAVAALCPQHRFLFLTKRAKRMQEYFDGDCLEARITSEQWAIVEDRVDPLDRRTDDIRATALDPNDGPLPNVWLGVSVENQQYADERIPLLLQTPAVVRWISAEPLLGPVDLLKAGAMHMDYEGDPSVPGGSRHFTVGDVDWVVVGGESGPGARSCDVAWIRSIVQQCKAAGVACFVKQLGKRPIDSQRELAAWPNGAQSTNHNPEEPELYIGPWTPILFSGKGSDPAEWPKDLRVREMPELPR